MTAKLPIFILCLMFLPVKAEFIDFAKPKRKAIQLLEVQKELFIKNQKKRIKNNKIQTAVIWKLPNRNFLGKRLSDTEEELTDKEALNRLIEAATNKNPELFQVYRNKNKNKALINKFTNLIANHTQSEFLNNYIQSKDYKEEEQKQIVSQEIKKITKLYKELKKLYSAKPNKDISKYKELKIAFRLCCGLENFIYVESLLKREIYYENYNT